MAHLAYAYGRAERVQDARKLLAASLISFDHTAVSATLIAEIYIGLGETDRAFIWLQKAVENRDVNILIESDPLYDPIRKDPRFAGLERRMNLRQ